MPISGHMLFRIINQKDGDKRIVWNSKVLQEITHAKDLFNELLAEGLVPHRVDPLGKQTDTVMKKFDPTAEEVIFVPVPALVGG